MSWNKSWKLLQISIWNVSLLEYKMKTEIQDLTEM